MGQSVGGAKTGEPLEKHLAHQHVKLSLSHVAIVGLKPIPDTAVFILIQFYVPFKIISAHIKGANQKVGRKWENLVE